MRKLTSRSQVVARFTTCPADMGYDGEKTDWKNRLGERMGLRRACDYSRELDGWIGQGVFKIVTFFRHGEEISLDEIQEKVFEMDYEKNM